MKNFWRDIVLWAGSVNGSSTVMVIVFLLVLAMFVVAAGAPEAGGSSIR